LCDDAFLARLSRAHNDANVLCMGVNVTTPNRAEWIVQTWLSTPFDHGRHIPRLEKLDLAFQNHPESGYAASTNARDNALTNASVSERLSHPLTWERFSVALSLKPTVFAPVLFAGRLEEGLAAVAQAGLRHIELSLRDPRDIQVEYLAKLLGEHDLSLTAIATGQSCLHDRLCLASPEAELSWQTGERLKAYVEMAQQLGSGVIIGGVRGRMVGSESEMQVQRQRAVEVIKDCASFAQDKGVPLWLEPINRYETNFVNTSSQGAALLDEVGAPNFKLLLDTFHMNIEEPDIPSSISIARDCLGYIHFADSNRQAPGDGHVDFKGILKALDDIGYQGIISTEVLPLPDDMAALQKIGAFFQSLISSSQGVPGNP
jgi:sugar phosphate isomerase/epimerase